ncbi:MAG: endonuclease domain-containing protein [Clostridia bacterium]|nr:endonuclease domain-containing protein [Clostridia bacterium]
MNKNNNPYLTEISQELRRNLTKEEKHLWYDFLKALPQTINRQKVIGKYVVDFYCASAKIVIELDGSQHGGQKMKQKDQERDAFLNSLGITVLRYSNIDIHKNFNSVCVDILSHINTSSVSKLTPSPQGEG